jgi:hypothetical protein
MHIRTVALLIGLFCACSSYTKWRQVPVSDPSLGAAVWVEGDPNAPAGPPSAWHTWVVLRSEGKNPVQVCFWPENAAKVECPDDIVIRPDGLVALRVGPKKVGFLFRAISGTDPLPPAPSLEGPMSEARLNSDYPKKVVPRR